MIRRAPLRRAINIQLLHILGVRGTAHNRHHDNEAEHFASRPRCTIASDILRAQIKFRHIKAMKCAVNDGNAHDEPHRTHFRKMSRIDMLWRFPMHITYTCLTHLIHLFLHPIACLPFLHLVAVFKFVSMCYVCVTRTSSFQFRLRTVHVAKLQHHYVDRAKNRNHAKEHPLTMETQDSILFLCWVALRLRIP